MAATHGQNMDTSNQHNSNAPASISSTVPVALPAQNGSKFTPIVIEDDNDDDWSADESGKDGKAEVSDTSSDVEMSSGQESKGKDFLAEMDEAEEMLAFLKELQETADSKLVEEAVANMTLIDQADRGEIRAVIVDEKRAAAVESTHVAAQAIAARFTADAKSLVAAHEPQASRSAGQISLPRNIRAMFEAAQKSVLIGVDFVRNVVCAL